MSRRFAAVLLLLAAAVQAAAQALPPAEAYLVTGARADLYQGGRLAARLPPGSVILATPDPAHPGVLLMQHEGRACNSDRRQYQNRAEMEKGAAARIAALENTLIGQTQRLAANTARAKEVYAALVAINMDAVLRLRYAVLSPYGAVQLPGAGVQPVVMYRYETKILSTRARQLTKECMEEQRRLDEENRALRQARAAALQARAAALQERAAAEQALAGRRRAFDDAAGGGAVRKLHLCALKPAPLFQNQALAVTLPAGALLTGVPQPAAGTGWLQVAWQGRTFAAAANLFAAYETLAAEFRRKQAALRQQLADIEEQITFAAEQERLLSSAQFVLAVNSAAATTYIPISYPFDPASFAGRAVYPLAPCPSDAVIVMEYGPALRLSKEWAKELQAMRQAADKQRKDAGAVRQELAVLEAGHKPLLGRFEAAFPELRSAATPP